MNVTRRKISARERVASERRDYSTIQVFTKLDLAPLGRLSACGSSPDAPDGETLPQTSFFTQQKDEAPIAEVVGDDAEESMDLVCPEAVTGAFSGWLPCAL